MIVSDRSTKCRGLALPRYPLPNDSPLPNPLCATCPAAQAVPTKLKKQSPSSHPHPRRKRAASATNNAAVPTDDARRVETAPRPPPDLCGTDGLGRSGAALGAAR